MNDNLDGLLSPFLRKQRMGAAAPFIGGRVLDFGCGIGLVCDMVDANKYAGVDIDARVIEIARSRNPNGRFYTLDQMDSLEGEVFDTVVGLAIIEHLPDPLRFLNDARRRLAPGGRLVLTTPNPILDWAHGLGSRIGIFARESHDEHQSLMNRKQLADAGDRTGLRMTTFRRFLFGANQLAVFESGEK
ncbi:class I SAM-dependent methyltransferase [Mesorhizobium sp.]|uniref:class I SAM-dependent methyltransferase n=1 Tax=Mesorhizobium sp. TaxID=1871066 RepID=UPI000FE5D24B|nr:class I SAM-dependent methyltransferase [Mesorhizobium sp.]RWK09368.1 MAG: class I SAM-dependent methyltransferase [Mesorhizobium sp.]